MPGRVTPQPATDNDAKIKMQGQLPITRMGPTFAQGSTSAGQWSEVGGTPFDGRIGGSAGILIGPEKLESSARAPFSGKRAWTAQPGAAGKATHGGWAPLITELAHKMAFMATPDHFEKRDSSPEETAPIVHPMEYGEREGRSMSAEFGDLMERSLSGDSRSQKAIYDEFAPRVYRLAVRMAGEKHAADLTQETFLKVFRSLATFAGHASFSTWLYRIAVNECLQFRRRQRSPNLDLPTDLADRSPSPERRIEQAELIDWALDHLDDPLRAIFVLREVDGLSYQQIAAVLEIPAGTVASQLNRARAELRALLTKQMSE